MVWNGHWAASEVVKRVPEVLLTVIVCPRQTMHARGLAQSLG